MKNISLFFVFIFLISCNQASDNSYKKGWEKEEVILNYNNLILWHPDNFELKYIDSNAAVVDKRCNQTPELCTNCSFKSYQKDSFNSLDAVYSQFQSNMNGAYDSVSFFRASHLKINASDVLVTEYQFMIDRVKFGGTSTFFNFSNSYVKVDCLCEESFPGRYIEYANNFFFPMIESIVLKED